MEKFAIGFIVIFILILILEGYAFFTTRNVYALAGALAAASLSVIGIGTASYMLYASF
jgi:hypothetical protein